MKHLQNNYTTPEQSKSLLELGVPAGSADLFYFDHGAGFTCLPTLVDDTEYVCFFDERFLPCWSVGRLMEIFDMCYVKEQTYNDGWCSYRRLHWNQTYMDYILFVFTTNKMQDLLDFSKLEE